MAIHSALSLVTTTYPNYAAGDDLAGFLLVGVFSSSFDVNTPTSVMIGGQSAVHVAGDLPSTSQSRSAAAAYMLTHDQAVAAANGTIVLSGETSAQTTLYAIVFSDANQSAPVNLKKSYSASGLITMALDRVADSYTVCFAQGSVTESLTLNNPTGTTSANRVTVGVAADTERTVDTTVQNKTYVRSAFVFNISPPSAQSITDVNSGSGVKIGSTGNTATVTGAPSAATGGTLGGKPITIINWDSGTGVATFTAPSVVDGEVFPEFNSNQTLIITGSDWSVSLTGIALNTPTGSTLVTIASPNIVDQRKLGYHFLNTLGVTVVDGDQFYGVDADVEWLPDTDGNAGTLPITTLVVLRDASTGLAYTNNVTINGDGVVSTTYQKRYNQPGNLNPSTGLWGSNPYVAPVGQLIFNGTGFGTKSFNEPITFERWDGTDGQLVSDYDAGWVPYNGQGAVITDINPRFAGHKSAYNNPARNPTPGGHSQFWTNTKTDLARKGRTRLYSYWVRVNYREDLEKGQIKFGRVTTSAASGGGGVYNGVGSQSMNGIEPKNTQVVWSGSDGAFNSPGYLDGEWYPDNRWIRLEYEIYLSDLDVTNGFYNVHAIGQGSLTSGNIMQRFSGHDADDFLLDTVMLGLETANPETWLTPNVLTPETTYTYSATKSGTTYSASYTSGLSAPTAADVVNGLIASFLADGVSEADINTNPENPDEFSLYWGFEDKVYSSNLTWVNPISVQQGETYVDDDLKQVYIGDADTWAACGETHPQPYNFWSDLQVRADPYFGGISGSKYGYKRITPNTTPVLVGPVIFDGTNWVVNE